MTDILEIGKRAKEAAKSVNIAALDVRNAAISNIAEVIDKNRQYITEQNNIDIENAESSGMSAAMIDRLRLTDSRLDGIIKSMGKIVMYPNPIGKVESGSTLENGLKIVKTRVPLGVIGIIFESRPNVSVDAAALCIKSGNAVILRGGKEAIHSNIALASLMRQAINKAGLPLDAVQMVENTSREEAKKMMQLNGYIDVLIPRGGAGLINNVVKNATVPVIETGAGNCHVYVDYNTDVDMAADIINNAKTSRPSVCNAAETLLVHKDIAAAALPTIKAKLDESNVELRGCPETIKLLGSAVVPASDEDYYTEYNDYILAVKVVASVDEAIEHINKYNTKHSEAIVTKDYANAQKFLDSIDAAAVYVNASTRFTDGELFGLGAEIGIATQKSLVRGPMGADALTCTKYLIYGNGQIR